MPRESELKYLDVDLDVLRQRVKAAGGVFEGRWLETNKVFDDESGGLKRKETLLRLRTCAGTSHGLLTMKRPVEEDSRLKVCDEHETQVLNTAQTEALLEGLGFRQSLVYQKLRESWRMEGLLVCLDLLPFGTYAELEGEEPVVLEAAEALGLDQYLSSKETYYDIHARVRRAAGLPPKDSFVFDKDLLDALLADLKIGRPTG